VTARAEGAAPGMAAGASRRAAGFAVAVLCLLLAARLSDVLYYSEPGQVPFTVALFVLPLLYAFPGTRRLLGRYRWPVLAVQAVLTWVPFAVFGGRWEYAIGGLLAGLVLLTVPGRVSWLLAGLLLAAEVVVRTTVTGLPLAPAWSRGPARSRPVKPACPASRRPRLGPLVRLSARGWRGRCRSRCCPCSPQTPLALSSACITGLGSLPWRSATSC